MTYMNAWPDRWRGSNDLGQATAALVRPAKLCNWIKIFHVSQLDPYSHVCKRHVLEDVNVVIQHHKQVGVKGLVYFRSRWVCP